MRRRIVAGRPGRASTTRGAVVAAVALLCAVALGGCATPVAGSTPQASGGVAGSVPAASAGSEGAAGSGTDLRRLVGAWTIHDTGTADDGAVIFLSGRWATIYRACGSLDATVNANPAGAWHAATTMTSGECPEYGNALTDGDHWLVRADAVAIGDDSVELRRDGEPLARLTRGGTPVIAENIWAESVVTPSLDPASAKLLAPERPALPAGLRAPSEAQIVGRWQPGGLTAANAKAHASFLADGTWSGSDGCNGQSGAWALGADGWWSGGAGNQTLVFCDNVDIGAWIGSAWQVGITDDGGELVFLGTDGKELGRLRAG